MKIVAQMWRGDQLVDTATNGFSKPRHQLETRDDRLEHALHAEMRLLINDKTVCDKKIIKINLAPCKQCAGYIAESGIEELWVPSNIPERWTTGWNSCVEGLNIVHAAGIKIRFMDIASGDDLP